MRKDYSHICSNGRHQVLGPDGSVLCSAYDDSVADLITAMFNVMPDLVMMASTTISHSRIWPDSQTTLVDTLLVPVDDIDGLEKVVLEYREKVKGICGALR